MKIINKDKILVEQSLKFNLQAWNHERKSEILVWMQSNA